MKSKLLPTLLILLFLSSTAFGQIPFKLGVRAGLDIGNLSFDPDITGLDKSSRMGFKFGAMAELGFVPMFAIQIEPMYAQKGAVIEGNFNTDLGVIHGKVTFKAAELEIPILLKLRIPTPGAITPYVFAGPNIAFILSSSQEVEAQGQNQDNDTKDQTSSTNFALDLGAGVELKIAPLTLLLLDARYSLGLSDLSKESPQDQLNGGHQSIKTRDIQILVGIMFGL
jgi:opacity protein-like surface antigen